MTLRLDATTRAQVRALDAAKRAALRPAKEQARQERKAERKAQPKREARTARTVDPVKRARGRVLEPAYLAFLRRQSCCVGPHLRDGCEGRTDPAHLRFSDAAAGRRNPGPGRKSDDRWCVPLCRKHHDAQHARGNERAWWASVGLDPNELALSFYRAFQEQPA